MGKLRNDFTFTGRVGNVTAYTMRGHEGIILRSRGGASKSAIRNSPSFEPTRNLNKEWAGVTQTAAMIRRGLSHIRILADYNISGPMNAIVKKIQVKDQINPAGQRAILLSRYPDFISSFNFNRKTLFESIFRQPVSAGIDQSTGMASFGFPSLQPSINFFPHPFYSYYRLIVTAAAVSDYVADEKFKKNYSAVAKLLPEYKGLYSDWFQCNIIRPASDYHIPVFNKHLPGPDMILISAAGIQYGVISGDGSIQPAPYTGAAKILRVV
jgi:hypothetical protein